MRIIFVGLHNKPYMAPLDSGTKTGKLINKIIKELPKDIEIVKTNILDVDHYVKINATYNLANEWYWTHLPVYDDIVILLGAMTQLIHKTHVKNVGKIIRVAHPASKRSHKDMNNYIIDVASKINNAIQILNNNN